ncbi:Crp/Fnr family transcriptional regulator [Roseivirga pacifica]|uniref:Crp/Fnr family transcriptional regulator n=1 Tax=Roseivirga pacifica TaxID=1267423 RepID=UPI003BB1A6CB
MAPEQIKKHFQQLVGISEEDWQFFASKLTKASFKKKDAILRTGQVENHLSFIEQGMVRFFIPEETKDLTFAFAFENNFVSAYDSFLTQTPCTYGLEALSDTILWQVSFDELQEIYAKTTVGNTIGRLASEDLFLKKSARELSLLNDTAEERYLKLFSKRPELIQKIPLKYLASYIGITPQALSRIRRRIS